MALGCDEAAASNAYAGARELIRAILYSQMPPEEALELVPESLGADLTKLLIKTVYRLLPEFKQAAISAQPSLPHLEAVDWQVNVKTASSQLHSMAVPTVLVSLKVQE